MRFELWRPAPSRICPPTLGARYALWWIAHYAGAFRNRDYAVLLIAEGGTVVHRSCAIPAYFRWPFMNPNDLQVSSTWTAPDYRGRGLATIALKELMALLNRPSRDFWYLARAENAASIAVCQKAGFRCVGEARRTSRLGMRVLGSFEICRGVMDDLDTRRVA